MPHSSLSTPPFADDTIVTIPQGMTALQRHVAFFDRNGDQRVTVGEVVETLKLLGCSGAYAFVNGVAGMLARTTEAEFASHEVVLANAHRGKFRAPDLTGETRIFDREGNFDEARFNEVLARYGRSNVDGLTESDIAVMIGDISLPGTVGRASSLLAFRLLMTIAGEAQSNGELAVTRARLRAFYEGNLFPQLLQQSTLVANAEPIASTIGDVCVGAVRVLCPFHERHERPDSHPQVRPPHVQAARSEM